MVCDAVLSDTQVPTSWWNLAFPSSGLEGKNSCILKRGGTRFLQIVWVYLPNIMESHPVTSFSTNLSPHYRSHA